jgi:hypothetical protein
LGALLGLGLGHGHSQTTNISLHEIHFLFDFMCYIHFSDAGAIMPRFKPRCPLYVDIYNVIIRDQRLMLPAHARTLHDHDQTPMLKCSNTTREKTIKIKQTL